MRTEAVPSRIVEGETRTHAKASERYIDVEFNYPGNIVWEGSVPVEYRRTGVNARSGLEVREVLETAYSAMRPDLSASWLADQQAFWGTKRDGITRAFFDALSDSDWKCVGCELPANPNWARRVQDLKEMGYTISTDTRRRCEKCGRKRTQLILLRLPRGVSTGYESWTPLLRQRIIEVLRAYDAYEDSASATHLLPDHKFPEIRWDAGTRVPNPITMTDKEITDKFQLLNNQRNQQKREVCRACFQTGRRGRPFGINFFHTGGPDWPAEVPKTGKKAEAGCYGCGWYDLKTWRHELNNLLVGRSDDSGSSGGGYRASPVKAHR